MNNLRATGVEKSMWTDQLKRTGACFFATILLLAISNTVASAHPGDGIVVDPEGTIYFVARNPLHDTDHHACIYRFKEGDDNPTPFYTSPHPSSNVYLVMGLDGNLYGAESNYLGERHGKDVYTTKVWQFDESGNKTEVLGPRTGRSPYGGPGYLVDKEGAFYFASNSTIRKRDRDGREMEFYRTPVDSAEENAGLKAKIFNLAWGPNHEIYLLYVDRAEILERDGGTRLLFSGLENLPFDIDVDSRGDVYLPDWRAKKVFKITAAGTRPVVLESAGSWGPEGVAVQGDNLIVLEFTGPPATRIVPRITRIVNGTAEIEPFALPQWSDRYR